MSNSTAERNAELVRYVFEELINRENSAVIDEVYGENLIVHDPFSGVTHGREALKQLLAVFDTAFPHHRVEIHHIAADDEYVSILHTHVATHTGPIMGMPPTGRSIRVEGIEMMRVVDGKIVEFWRHDDDAGMMMQLGMIPAPAAAGS